VGVLCVVPSGLVLYTGITSCTFPPWTEVSKKKDYELWTCPDRNHWMHLTCLLWILMETILSRIILESTELSWRVKRAKQDQSASPFKQNKRTCWPYKSLPNLIWGNTTSKEITSESEWDGYTDLVGSSMWDSSASISAQLGVSLLECSVVSGIVIYKSLVGLSSTSINLLTASLSIVSVILCKKLKKYHG